MIYLKCLNIQYDHTHFEIEQDSFFPAITHLLIENLARTRAIQEVLINRECEKRGVDFDEVAAEIDESIAFHKDNIMKSLFSQFASLKNILPNDINPSEGC